MLNWIQKTGTVISALMGLFLGCKSGKLPLVRSIPVGIDTDSVIEISGYVLTDSFAVMLQGFEHSRHSSQFLFRRIPLKNGDEEDTLTIHLDDDLPAFSKLSRIQDKLTPSRLIVTPFALGDSSRMINLGRIEGDFSKQFTRLEHEEFLRDQAELFYVLDVGRKVPQTILRIEGRVLDVAYPYLLIQTNFSYRADIEEDGEYAVVDLDKMEIILRGKLNRNSWWEKNRPPMRITSDGKLYHLDKDTAAISYDDRQYYLPQHDVFIRAEDYANTAQIYAGKFGKCANELYYQSNFSPLAEYFFLAYAPIRYYEVTPRSVLVRNLPTLDSVRELLFLPNGVFNQFTRTFFSAQGEVMFANTPGGWGYPGYGMSRLYPEVPAVSDLRTPPRELKEFRPLMKGSRRMRLTIDRVESVVYSSFYSPEPESTYSRYELSLIVTASKSKKWWFSPSGKWLVVGRVDDHEYFYYKSPSTWPAEKAVLMPTEVLTDTVMLKKRDGFVHLSGKPYYLMKIQFSPDEEWIAVTYFQKTYTPIFVPWLEVHPELFRTGRQIRPFRIGTSDEYFIKDISFSPDGRYVGYVCRIEGKEGHWLQVRRLPE